VKLIDVYPDSADRARLGGYEMLIRGDVLRGKFRNSISRPEPFVPGRVTPIRFDMSDVFHTFKRGHRVMVQVQSTWFPMIDRNPGRFEDIYHAAAADFHKTVQRVYRSGTAPSAIVLPVLP
jgi:predicted acyl esterase